jgi:hypothetical protein
MFFLKEHVTELKQFQCCFYLYQYREVMIMHWFNVFLWSSWWHNKAVKEDHFRGYQFYFKMANLPFFFWSLMWNILQINWSTLRKFVLVKNEGFVMKVSISHYSGDLYCRKNGGLRKGRFPHLYWFYFHNTKCPVDKHFKIINMWTSEKDTHYLCTLVVKEMKCENENIGA